MNEWERQRRKAYTVITKSFKESFRRKRTWDYMTKQ